MVLHNFNTNTWTPHQGASFVEKQMKYDGPQFIGETRYGVPLQNRILAIEYPLTIYSIKFIVQ